MLFLSSCTPSIKVDKRSASPELLECRMMFGQNIHELKLLSASFLQTGVIDTTTETPPIKVAVVMIGRKDYYLHLINTKTEENEIQQSYAGNGYNLILSYHENGSYNHLPKYEGKFTISDSINKAEYKVEGYKCDL